MAVREQLRAGPTCAIPEGFMASAASTVLLFILLFSSGCATRRYVDTKIHDRLNAQDREQYEDHMRLVQEICDTQREIDTLKRSLSRSSEIRRAMHADRWTRELNELDREMQKLRKEISGD
jgi:hypothetical protein